MPPTTTPTPQARAWASRAVAEYGIRDRAQDILARLYVPGLPEVAAALHTEITASADAARRGPRNAPLPPPGPGIRAITDTLDPELRWSVLLWCRLVAGYRTIYSADEPQSMPHSLYRSLAGHLKDEAGDWDAARMGLVLEAASQYLLPLEHVLRMCRDAPDAALLPHLELLRVLYVQSGDRYALGWTRANPTLDELSTRTAQLLLRLGAPLPLDELFVPGDVFGDVLRHEHPDLCATPGLAGLVAGLLTPPGTHPSKAWRRRTAALLDALEDPGSTVREVLALVPALPAAPAEKGEAHSPYLRPHVHDILTGMVWCVDLLPRESTPWAALVLERLTVFTGTGPGGSRMLRSERMATAAVRILSRRGGEHERDALTRIRAQVAKKTLLRTIDTALAQTPAPAGTA